MSSAGIQDEPHVWYPDKHADPQKWGGDGWAFLMGTAALIQRPSASPVQRAAWLTLVEKQSALLMCIFCSRHFQSYVSKRGLPSSNYLEWIYKAWSGVHLRALVCFQSCQTELWLRQSKRSVDDWSAYFDKRHSHPAFQQLWLFDCFVFLTVLLRCLPPPDTWSVALRVHVCAYLDGVSILLNLPIQRWSLVPLTIVDWSMNWHHCLSTRLSKSSRVSAVHQLSRDAFTYYPNY